MAFGIIPKHDQELYLENFTSKQFLTLAIEAAQQQDWDIRLMSDTRFLAHTNKGVFSWNAKIIFQILEDKAIICSESTSNEMKDWGKNKRNFARFTNAFIDLKTH